tara:strand:- start:1754 stop:1972 length:219 start_codon:yes stop_codon:yes gene_type:complete
MNRQEHLKILKHDLKKVKETLLSYIVHLDGRKRRRTETINKYDKDLYESYELLEKHLTYNGVLTSIKDDYII